MTVSQTKKMIWEHINTLPGEQVKTLLLTWLINSSGDLEDFEQFLTNQTTQTAENCLEYGAIDSDLNFQALTEDEMVQQSKLALESYYRKGIGITHYSIREWADSLGTEGEKPCPK
ncbi:MULTISPECIES: hypothetical protein [unclassified Spirulina]|uniref:hypothetical protein n=1 Tax=unclassified Spirulina TaxID=2684457 RepID=UPI0019500F69|nr:MULTISPECIES: hypothetical protein [Spirulina]MEA5471902.1 hypothetical protein [Spirulina sp. 06S082]